MPTTPITTRLPERLEAELRDHFEERGEGPSEGLRRIVEERWAMERFPEITFRDGPAGRRATLRRGPDVWELIMVWRDYDPDLDGFRAHFGGDLTPDEIHDALGYYERFPEPVDAALAENERMERYLRRTAARTG